MPLCDEAQKASLQQVTQMLDNIHNFQEMMDMAKSMQELFPEGFSDLDGCDPAMLSELFAATQNQSGGQQNGLFPDSPLDAG